MQEGETMLAERPRQPKAVLPVNEPATPRALWPTFMRRTLCEETVRTEAERHAARPGD